MYKLRQILLLFGIAFIAGEVNSQGRVLKPISRTSAFRDPIYNQYNPPINYDDHRLNCGGLAQDQVVGGNCGVCGDAYSLPSPRPYEMDGINYRGFFTGTYTAGSVMETEIDILNSKNGYMEFRLCATPFSGESQTCFNRYLLERADGEGSRIPVTDVKLYSTQMRLPAGVTCQHCVLQWNYRVANNWGDCGNGTGAIGCGPQETFRGCSDIKIT